MLRALQDADVRYVVIGAMAMALQGIVRGTNDVDIVIQATSENVNRLREALRMAYPGDPAIDEILDRDLLGDYSVVRYCPPTGGHHFDLIAKLDEVATFETIEAEVKEISGIRVPVATPRALYLMKKDTLRPLDHRDAAMLRSQLDVGEED